MAAPAGPRPTLGLDPGIRTGVKAAVVDATGKLLETATLYPFQPRMDVTGSQSAISSMIQRHGIELVAIGNGTASRETERLVAETIKQMPQGVSRPASVIVSEAGGQISDRDNRPLAFNNPRPLLPGVIAANRPIHAALMARRIPA